MIDRMCNDVLTQIALRLTDTDLFNLCEAFPKLHRINDLWRDRFLKRFGKTPVPKQSWSKYYWTTKYILIDICWVEISLSKQQIVFSQEDLYDVCYFIGCSGDRDLINFIINLYSSEETYEKIIEGASRAGKLEMVKYLLELSEKPINLNRALANASTGPHYELVEYLIDQGADDWSSALIGAAESGDHDLFNCFFQKAQPDHSALKLAMISAVRNKDHHLVCRLANLGSDNWNEGLSEAVLYEDLDLVKWFLEKGAKDFDDALYWSDFSKIPDYPKTIRDMFQNYI